MDLIKSKSKEEMDLIKSKEEMDLIKSKDQTKNWRKSQQWYKGGKSNECELYQRGLIEQITKEKCIKTRLRINFETNKLIEIKNVLNIDNGFDLTEDFDGIQKINNNTYLYNLKFVCDAGGAQTRTLREVYHFIKAQLEYLIDININTTERMYFINIIDGDESSKHMHKFLYLLNLDKYKNIKNYMFIGDMYDFNQWFNNNNNNIIITKIKEIEKELNEMKLN